MKINFSLLLSNKTKKTEIAVIGIITLFFILFFRKIFIGQQIFSHDSIRWYSVYHLFADSLLNGNFPYWDPYDFCGQPFYYNLGILRLYEPITIIFVILGKVFNLSMLITYHWEYMFRVFLTALGAYFCFRQTNKYFISNIIVFTVFLFSSFTVTSFRQNGFLYVFFWTPWVVYFLLKLLKKFNFYNVAGFSFFTGLGLTSYQGSYPLTYLFVFILTLLINNRKYLASTLKNTKNIAFILLGLMIIVTLALPLLTVAIEQNKIVPTARLDDKAEITEGVKLTYATIKTAGTHSAPMDFLELILPALVKGYYIGRLGDWLSECFLYIGIFPLMLALIGIFLTRDKYWLNFLIVLVVIGLLMLGPKGLSHRILYFSFYPLRFARHMHLFSSFFIFTLFYFVGQGMDFILGKIYKR